MKKSFFLFVSALLLSLGGTHEASAASLSSNASYVIGGSSVGGTAIDLSGISTGTISTTPRTETLSSGVQIDFNYANVVSGNKNSPPPTYATPAGLSSTDHFIATAEKGNTIGSTVISNIPLSVTTVGFLWGSIEGVNELIITDRKNEVSTILGDDLLKLLASGATSYFSFTDLDGIASIKFTMDANGSSNTSFEVANISFVPLPAALPLFGLSVAGLAALRRRRMQAKA